MAPTRGDRLTLLLIAGLALLPPMWTSQGSVASGDDAGPATTVAYAIDPMQRRIETRVDGILTQRFLYRDGLNPVAEIDSAGAVLTRFVYGARGNVPDYMVRGGNTYRILSDQRGSVRVVVDVATDSVVQLVAPSYA